MANWAELPKELLVSILQRITTLSDHIHFSSVCSSWRLVGVQYRPHISRQLPGLMIPSTKVYSETRRFLLFPECRVYEQLDLPVPHLLICNGSMEGWIIVTHLSMDMNLLNPFSGARIQLPSVTTLLTALSGYKSVSATYVTKAILSANPTLNREAMVLVIYGNARLAFCKLGDKAWIPIETPKEQWYWDAIWHMGKFYAVYNPGVLVACNTDNEPKVTKIVPAPKSEIFMKRWYLVECGGALLLVRRECRFADEKYYSDDEEGSEYDEEDNEEDVEDYKISDEDSSVADEDEGNYHDNINNDHNNSDDESDDDGSDMEKFNMTRYDYNTFKFEVYKLLSCKRKWVKVEHIGDYALFLGFNNSFSLSTVDFPAYKGDCIYFTDDKDNRPFDLKGGHDMGFFNLKNKTVKPLYPIKSNQLMKPLPIWITPIPW